MARRRAASSKILICNRQKSVRVFRDRLRRLVRFVARAEGRRIALVDLAVVDAGEMAALNRRYRRHAGTTDVLSFDLSDDPAAGIAAQIIVCGDLAAQAPRHGQTAQQELALYVIHGLLHLTGYDDARQAARMRAREQELLAGFPAKRRSNPG